MNLPTCLLENERLAIQQAVRDLRKNHPHQIRYLALFGSKARGDFQPGSDLDLLVIAEDDNWQSRRAIRDPIFDAGIDYSVYLSPRVIGWERFIALRARQPGFFENLQRDAIELWRRPGMEDPLHSNPTLVVSTASPS